MRHDRSDIQRNEEGSSCYGNGVDYEYCRGHYGRPDAVGHSLAKEGIDATIIFWCRKRLSISSNRAFGQAYGTNVGELE